MLIYFNLSCYEQYIVQLTTFFKKKKDLLILVILRYKSGLATCKIIFQIGSNLNYLLFIFLNLYYTFVEGCDVFSEVTSKTAMYGKLRYICL